MPPELVFDTGLGDLFVVRLAGHVVSSEVMGSFQYGGKHLGTPLFVVLGHERCGAVKAALEALDAPPGSEDEAHGHERIDVLLRQIQPGLVGVDHGLEPVARLDAAVEANVRWSLRQLRETPEARMREKEGVMKLVGGVYDLDTGLVQFLT